VVSVLVGWVPVDRGAVDAAGETAWSDDRVVAKMLVSGGVPVPSGAIARAPAELADWLRSRRPPARDAALGEAAWAAEAALFAYLAGSPLASRRPVGDGFAFRTGLFDNTRNGIVCSRVDGGLADVLAWLDAPAQWLVGAGSDLRARLERAGCRPERTAVFMAAELGEPQPADSAATPADGADGIAPIEDEATLRAALAATDELEPDAGEAALLASLGLSGDRSLRHFAAFRDGAPVGLVSTFSSASALTITNLAVAPEWRRRGLGRALVRHVARGLTLLAPTPATIPFYEGLGFRLLRFPPDRTFYTPAG
jgi:GNAT superfamily N-acetyltransferase